MKKILKIIPGLIFLIFISSSTFTEGEFKLTYSFSGDMTLSLDMNGIERTYNVHIPEGYNSEELFPVVFVFHGGGGTGEGIAKYTGFNDLAKEEKFIVVYPDGYDKHWNDGRKDVDSKAHQENMDDIQFIRAILETIKFMFKVDETRIYAVGISNGAMFSLRIACELSDQFAAVAAVAGSIPEDIADSCSPGYPISVLIINGTDDELVPYEGGEVKVFRKSRGKVIPTIKTVEKFVLHNKCTIKPVELYEIDEVEDDDMVVQVQVYRNEETGVEVVLYKIEGGGHTWPGGRPYAPKFIVGKTNRDIDATEVIWTFFKTKTK